MKSNEIVQCIFNDGFNFWWHVGEISSGREILRIIKRKGMPIKIVGDGYMAEIMRKKIIAMGNGEDWHLTSREVVEVGVNASGLAESKVAEKYRKVKRVFGR